MSERRRPLPQLTFAFDSPNAKTAVATTVADVDANHTPALQFRETGAKQSSEDADASSQRRTSAELSAKIAEAETNALTPIATREPSPKVRRPKSKVLEEKLAAELGEPVRLVLTDNKSLLLSTTRRKGLLTARVHQMFLGAGVDEFDAIAKFLARGDKQAGKVIDAFVEDSGHVLKLNTSPLPKNAGKGRVYDLDEIYDDVNRAYFGGIIDAEIMWGQAGAFRGRRRRSITLGSYDSQTHRITMHPALDHADVPKICVARVVHHEMLHIKHPTVTGPSGRRIVHGSAFRAEEAEFLGAKEADAWIDANLEAILRYRPGRR